MLLRLLASLLLVSLFVAGCKDANVVSPEAENSKSESSDRDRPPLRIGLIEQPNELEESLRLRWSSVSEQKLEFLKINVAELDPTTPPQIDLLFAPTLLIGTLVENGWVSEVPEEVASNLEKSSTSDATTKVDFPSHWLEAVRYGKKLYALPLGCTLQLVGDQRSDANAPIRDTRATASRSSLIDWSRCRVTGFGNSESFNQPDLVDQFLSIAATTRPNAYEGSLFFKLVDCSARVSEPWMVNAALRLRELYANTEDGSKELIQIGWPSAASPEQLDWTIPLYRSSDVSSQANKEGSETTSIARAIVDGGRGTGVFLSSRTRQSSKATYLLRWLSEPAQLTSIAKLWPWSFPESKVDDPSDAGYATVAYQAAMADDIASTFQIKQGMLYRAELFKTLKEIVTDRNVDPLQALEKCRQSLNSLTDKLGRDQQQDSLERALGLRE